MYLLIPAALVCLATAYLSFAGYSSASWFLGAMCLLGATNAYLWGIAAQVSRNAEELFIISCAWDLMVLSVYVGIPFIVGKIELSAGQLTGVALMVVGFLMVKFRGA